MGSPINFCASKKAVLEKEMVKAGIPSKVLEIGEVLVVAITKTMEDFRGVHTYPTVMFYENNICDFRCLRQRAAVSHMINDNDCEVVCSGCDLHGIGEMILSASRRSYLHASFEALLTVIAKPAHPSEFTHR